jgi:hypothetical protein
MPRGDQVIVRTFGSVPRVRRVWDADQESVAIHDEEQYQRRLEGRVALQPVYFRRADVFVYDVAIFPAKAEDTHQNAAFWSALQPY